MNIIANNVAAKLSVVFVAVAMLLTLTTPAKAQTAEELQQMINDLLAQVSSLQGQLGQDGGSASAAGVCPYTWTRSLNTGASGADVMKLQQFLNADADTRVAATGVGSAGMESEYYGGLTAAAVSKFQTKYRSDILSPVGLVNPTGYFGPSTMAKANALCASSMPSDDSDDSDDADDADDSDGELGGGESSLESFEGSDGDDTDLEEGQEDAPVAEFEFDVEDGDIEINRVDLVFGVTADANDETDPWDVFEEVSIWVDGDKVAEMDAGDEDEWSDDEPAAGLHTLRFTGVDSIFREGDTAQIVVGVTVQNSVDGTADGSTWTVAVDNEGIRGTDGEGIDQYTGEPDTLDDVADMNEGVDFEINEEGGDDELNIQTSDTDPDADTFAVDENTNSDWFTIFAFDLDTDDSVNDIAVETIVVHVQTGSAGAADYTDIVNDAQLLIDGETYDDVTVATPNASSTYLTFDIDKDLVIEAGDEVTAELQLEFKKRDATTYAEGTTVAASTTDTMLNDWAAEGADDLTVDDQLDGAATGETHTLRTEGVVLDFDSASETKDANSDTTTADDEGVFKITFDVTAFEADIWINQNATSAAFTNGILAGVEWSLEGDSTTGTTSSSLSSSADEEGDYFKVAEGQTESFTVTVSFDPATSAFYNLQLDGVNFNTSSQTAADTQQLALPASDFETDDLDI